MTVEAVIFDVSGTLINERTGQAQADVAQAIERLQQSGLLVVAAGNHPRAELRRDLARARLAPDVVVGRDDVGRAKGSPLWIDYICSQTGLQRNQLFYVGDSHLDMVTAVQGRVIYAHAAWAAAASDYGLVAPRPGWVPVVIEHIFRKPHLWYWELDTSDRLGRPVWVKTLINARGAGVDRLYTSLFDLLKRNGNPMVGLMPLRDFIMLHMLSSIYASDILSRVDYWTTYPGSTGSENLTMGIPLDRIAKLFRQHRYEGLFVRHTPAMHSKEAFDKGGFPGALENQIETVKLQMDQRHGLLGKSLLVVDNYLTRGPTAEAARNMLMAAGAREVFAVAVSKYESSARGYEYAVFSPPAEAAWNPSIDIPPSSSQFHMRLEMGGKNVEALSSFANSYRSILAEQW